MNIDHVATLRQARQGVEPDPCWAAVEAQLGGADCITVHLREDRRHIQDDDVCRLKSIVQVKYNLEMAATDEMVAIACELQPQMVTLVPEGRYEVTTEGGLDVVHESARLRDVVARLSEAGVVASAFVDPEPAQVEASAQVGFAYCEIHTGPYAQAFAAERELSGERTRRAWREVAEAGRAVSDAGLRFNAGHGLNYVNVTPIASLPGLCELHIGHAVVSHAVFVGMRSAVSRMKGLLDAASSGMYVASDGEGG